MKSLTTVFFMFLIPVIMFAQWSKDPYDNTQFSVNPDSTLSAKVVADNNGNYYMLYFNLTNADEHFHLYLQKLDKDGEKLWADRGIKICETPFEEWISDYDLKVDDDGSAIITFEDARDENIARIINIYKISPDGKFLWGNDGVQMPGKDGEAYLSPKFVKTSDNNFLVLYTTLAYNKSDGAFMIAKLNDKGELLKYREVKHVYAQPNFADIWPNIFPTSDGNAFLVWNKIETTTQDTMIGGWGDRKLYAQKIDKDLNNVWKEDVILAQSNTYYGFRIDHTVDFALDANKELYVSWYDNTNFQSTVKINHIDGDGNLKFGDYGLEIEKNNNTSSNLSPVINYDINEKGLFIYWIEENIKVTHRGTKNPEYSIYANKMFDDKSTWEWGDKGKLLMISECGLDPYLIKASNMSSGFQVLFFTDKSKTLEVCKLSADGDVNGFVLMSDNPYGKGHPMELKEKIDFSVTNWMNDQWVVSWIDVISYIRDSENTLNLFQLKAQNISSEGKLGPVSTEVVDLENPNENISLYPNPSNTQLNIKYNYKIENQPLLAIYSLNGQLLMNVSDFNIAENIISFDTSKLEKGVYIIKITTNNKVKSVKFVK